MIAPNAHPGWLVSPSARGPATLAALSPRQLEAARMVARGLTNASIAAELGTTTNAVNKLLERIYDRLRFPERGSGIGPDRLLAATVAREDRG